MAKFIQYSTIASQYDGPFDSVVGWKGAGMGGLFVSGNKKLIAIDGGWENDAENYLELLKQHSDGEKPVVDLWIITHSHPDHMGVLREIVKHPETVKKLEIKKIMYWFPIEFRGGILEKLSVEMEAIAAVFGAETEQPYRDQIITIDDLEIQFLFVPDDCSFINKAGGNDNHCSLIFSVRGPSRRAIITGDAYPPAMQITAWRYHHELKSDIIQLPHHALCDAFCDDFYRYISPDVVFMPTSIAGYRTMHSDMYRNTPGYTVNLVLEAKAKKVYKAFEGTAEEEI